MAKYQAQRHRLDAIEAAIGRRGDRVVIVGGLPEGYQPPGPPPVEPARTDAAPEPPRNRPDSKL
jgi:hypothetical protein